MTKQTKTQRQTKVGGKKKTIKNNKKIQNKKIQNKKIQNKISKNAMNSMVTKFMEMLSCIKLYHWKTMNKSVHDATDVLYSELNKKIDRFMELLIGKTNYKIEKVCFSCFKIQNKNHFIKVIHEFINYLRSMNNILDKDNDSELITVRDELIGDFMQLFYSIRLK